MIGPPKNPGSMVLVDMEFLLKHTCQHVKELCIKLDIASLKLCQAYWFCFRHTLHQCLWLKSKGNHYDNPGILKTQRKAKGTPVTKWSFLAIDLLFHVGGVRKLSSFQFVHMHDQRFPKYTLIRTCHFDEKTPLNRNLAWLVLKFYHPIISGFCLKVTLISIREKAGLTLKWKSEKLPFFLKTVTPNCDTRESHTSWFLSKTMMHLFAFLWSHIICTHCKLECPPRISCSAELVSV